jgi:peptide/nickel transport system ATP-binding protein
MNNVLANVTLRVPRGRTVAVVGESGSGKSTLARVITGLLPPREGEISFRSELLPGNLSARSKDTLRRLQMIYQMADVALNPRHQVRDILGRPLTFYLGLRGSRRERRIRELLRMIELGDDFADRYPAELSGGQKQRVCIARAIAAEPDLIICDEVTSSLDQLVAQGILALLLRLQHELGLAYLFITHDLAMVRSTADEIVVMHRGRVVDEGSKAKVLSPPHHPYTGLLLSSVPELDPDWLNRHISSIEKPAVA